MNSDSSLIVLTGATGYIGGRLLRALEKKGARVRCVARRPEYLKPKVGAKTEVVAGDLLDPPSLERALDGVHTAYYLVHSMAASGNFEEKDRLAAGNFASAAQRAGVSRIIYMGGLAHGEDLSPHLASRLEVGRILRESGVPTVEFRASVIIGSGSLSFELVRGLVERLPVMLTPRWVRTLAQPIAVEDVIGYLTAALDRPVEGTEVFEIGGADKVSYAGIMREYARQRGLHRLMIRVPFLTPHLSSFWLALITPLYARVGRQLLEGVRNDSTVHNQRALEVFPIRPRGIAEAVSRALANEDEEFAHTHWADSLAERSLEHHWGGVTFRRRKLDSYSVLIHADPEEIFPHIQCVGGKRGWYSHGYLWWLRGLADQILGGVGIRRGRRDPACVLPGDRLDFWRVEEVEEPRLLRMFAEMRMPGRAWLQVEVDPLNGCSRITLTAVYDPVGLLGEIYWYAVYPFHGLVFNGMLREMKRTVIKSREAERLQSADAGPACADDVEPVHWGSEKNPGQDGRMEDVH
ncbi:MAG: SDR family oxidoreductase [bacterium]|nr:MAG: SDR family oxidoreductase [bacterium]